MDRELHRLVRALLLSLDAPLVSFGAPMVDQNGVVQTFPALSMLTGLLANALGWDHRESQRLSVLQQRIRYAARVDRRGEALIDYQTVDLGQDFMVPENAGWTTRGHIAERGGASGDATHIRYRHYRADSMHTVALTVDGEAEPTVDQLAEALLEPSRPLFIGRKCCLPSGRILAAVVETSSVLEALALAPRTARADDGPLPATWFAGEGEGPVPGAAYDVTTTDERDWRNQVHTGQRLMREGHVDPPAAAVNA
jgi:CRISPR system Cascade subunit CasD